MSKNVTHRGSPTTKYKKKYRLKHLKAVPQKAIPGPKYKWFKISRLEFFFKKYYYGYTTFLYSSTRYSGHHQSFFNSTFSNRKSQHQQKLAKKISHFTAQFRLKILTYFTNLNLLDIENNMLLQRSQNPFWIYKFFSSDSVWCQKYHLHCTISWRPRTAFLKHFESKCLYISK